MREIKFRAWDATEERMLNYIEILHLRTGKVQRCNDEWDWYKRDRIVMQYTGMKDKNGKEIYEGDIVEHWSIGGIDKGPWIGEVTIHPTQGVKVGAWPICFDCEVIGNIYENGELLK